MENLATVEKNSPIVVPEVENDVDFFRITEEDINRQFDEFMRDNKAIAMEIGDEGAEEIARLKEEALNLREQISKAMENLSLKL
jgi:hypothetical protein